WPLTWVNPAVDSIEVAPFTAVPVTVRLDVPEGSGGASDTTVVTATVQGTSLSDTVTDVTNVTQSFGLSLEPDRAQTVAAGATVVYTHTLRNLGNSADVFSIDATNDTAGWPEPEWAPSTPSLPFGGETTIVVTVTVPSDAAGDVNETTVTASSLGGSASDFAIDTTTVATGPQPDLAVSKSVTPDPVTAGEQLTYTLYVTNTGAIELNATITDTLPSQVTPNAPRVWTPTIGVGDTWTQTLVVTATIGYEGPITNTVDVTTIEGVSRSAQVVSQVVPELYPGLDVSKSVTPDPVTAGEQLTYTLRVTNTGTLELNATITDTLPSQVTPNAPRVWTPTIGVGSTWTQTLVVTATEGYAGPITNTVDVTTAEGVGDSDDAVSQVEVAPEPELIVSKSVLPDPVLAGEQLTYTIRVTNTGNVALNATVTDTLPSQVTPNAPRVWTPTIDVGSTWTQTLAVTATAGYAGPITNTVEVTTAEGAVDDDTLVSQVETTPQPGVTVSKTAHPDPVLAGETLTYTIRVTNTGNVTLNASITDTLPTQVTPGGAQSWSTTLFPGEVWTQDLPVTVDLGYTGFLTNTVEVTSDQGATDVVTITSRVVGTPGVAFTPDNSAVVDPGSTITYTHHLTNTGDGPDVFNLDYQSSMGWPVILSENPVQLDAGAGTVISVAVTIPSGTGGFT
ncbi:MAG: DUF7507 domain-containing protein, partial [Anaerolineae bacterium]